MHLTFVIPLLTLFAAPSAHPHDWFSSPSPSVRVETRAASSTHRYITHSRTTLNRRESKTREHAKTVHATTSQPQNAPTAKPTTPPQNTSPSQQASTSQSTNAQRIEAEVVRLMNAERASAGLAPFSIDTTLTSIARAHSLDMRTNNFFSHTNLSGCSSSCRATNAGYRWRAIAENIYWMSGYDLSPEASAQKIVQGWMQSPGHRANILGNYVETGVGIDISGSRVTATANYGTERE